MYKYLVIVGDNNLGRAVYFEEPARRADPFEVMTQQSDVTIEWDSPLTGHDDMLTPEEAQNRFFASVKYVWCATEHGAKSAIVQLAKNQPGKRVFMTQVEGAAYAPPGDVTFQTVNEKGILPA